MPRPDLLRRMGHALLIPALILFSVRAGLQIAEAADLPGWSMAVVGVLSGLGMVVLVAVNWDTSDKWRTLLAVAVALLGHYVVRTWVDADLGGAMVYLGTGFLVSLKVRWAQFAGMIAGVGALLRGEVDVMTSHLMLIIGAVALSVAAGLAAFHKQAEPAPDAVTE